MRNAAVDRRQLFLFDRKQIQNIYRRGNSGGDCRLLLRIISGKYCCSHTYTVLLYNLVYYAWL